MTVTVMPEQRLDTAAIRELAELPQWVRWKYEMRDGKPTKPPFRLDGTRHASSTDPSTWATYDQVRLAHGDRPLIEGGGIGFVFAPDDAYVGVDLDCCRELEDGRITEWGQTWINALHSYTEISPSLMGVKVWLRGRWPGKGSGGKVELNGLESTSQAKPIPAIECYDRKRYFTVTGFHLEGTPETIESNQAVIDALYEKFFADDDDDQDDDILDVDIPASPGLSDDDILGIARHASNGDLFCRLFDDGDVSDYDGDPTGDNRADLALVNLLIFYTGDDVEQLDRLFRQSALSRPKWTHRVDYRERTIRKAAQSLTNVYQADAGPRVNLSGAARRLPRQDTRVWPEKIGEDAYHGPLGAVVKGIAPYTEADPAALFAHAITFAGAYVGCDVAIEAEDDEHPPRFYCCLVGNTSKGRKGTSAAPFRKVAGALQNSMRVTNGLSSSEGLIEQVRDPVEKWDVKAQATVIADKGVADKRLVLLEPELGGVLRRMQREGNALSATLREAWDHGNLATLVRRNPLTATRAHINLVAHITHDELKQCLADIDVSNGLVNRMLWFAVKRERLIPRSAHRAEVAAARTAFKNALEDARAWALKPAHQGHKVEWSDAAGQTWDALYETLSAEHVGMFGQATQRAEAYVLRLCVLYAVLDKAMIVTTEHLRAALAVWRYCQDSARWIFAGNTGNPTADRILVALRSSGEMTRSEISALFGHNLKAAAIQLALQTLVAHGLASFELRGSGASQTEVWRAL